MKTITLTEQELNFLEGHLSSLEQGIKQKMGNYTPDEYLQHYKKSILGCLKAAKKEKSKEP